MTREYANLHTHTRYSLLDGIGHAEKYFERAKKVGVRAIAQTDHGNLYGAMEFYKAGNDLGVLPILGQEFYQARKTRFDKDEEERSGPAEFEWQQRGPYHLTVMAKTLEGYRNLCRLSSLAFIEGYYGKPRIDFELLETYSKGLIIGSGCISGAVQQALMRGDDEYALQVAARYQDMVGKDSFFIEIQDHGLDMQRVVRDGTIEIARKLGAPIVPTGDCHYVDKEDAHYHDLSLCLGTGAKFHQENRFKFCGPEFYLKSYDEMAVLFDEQWLRNSLVLAEQVDVKLDFGKLFFPEYPDIPEGETPESFLEKETWAGLRVRYGDPIPADIQQRAHYELGVVNRMGFPEYFLVVADLVNWAKSQDIRVGYGRGSAAGSIISYALNITNLDPIRFGLMFERFLVEAKSEYNPQFPLLS